MKALTEHSRLLAEANVHIRRELGVPLDETDYLAHVQQMWDRMLARLQAALDQFASE